MNESQEKALQAWYAAYAERFRADGSLHPHLQLKLEHSERVAKEALELASELGWPEDKVRTAGVLGLLHDVGRFSQFAEFGTFNDRKSVDHGRRGREVLLSEAALAQCDARDRARVLDGVRHHNAASVPESLGDDSRRFVKLVRDADKLDLYDAALRIIAAGGLDEPDGLFRDVDTEAGPSPDVLEYLRRGRVVPNALVRSLADCLLWQLGWVYDVNYAPTMRRLKERRVLEKIRELLPEDAGVAEVLARAIEFRDGALAG